MVIKDYLGITTNLLLSLSVVAYGLFAWARESSPLGQTPFKRRAYLCWWTSWLAWVIAWTLILTMTHADLNGYMPLKIITMIFDNLNSICLIILFFVLTRGDDFGRRDILFAFAGITCPIAAAVVVLYIVVGGISPDIGYQMHFTWSLCLDIITPMLVGWGVYLRFDTLVPLGVGFTYGLLQPFVDTAELGLPATVGLMNPYNSIITMLTGGLKVVWALVFMHVLAYGADSGRNLVKPSTDKFRYLPLKRPLDKNILRHGILLGAVYVILLTISLMRYSPNLVSFSIAFGVVMGFFGLLDICFRVGEHFSQPDRANPASRFSAAATRLVSHLNDLVVARDSGDRAAREKMEGNVSEDLAQLAGVITDLRSQFSPSLGSQLDTLVQFLQTVDTDEVKKIGPDSEITKRFTELEKSMDKERGKGQ